MPKTYCIKHDTAANWAKAVNYIPPKGEVIIYDDMDPPFKIGDGIHNVNDLPFVNDFTWNKFPTQTTKEEQK